MAARLLDINPKAAVGAHTMFYLPETADEVDFSAFDYVIDAVDTVKAKIDIVEKCTALGVKVISAMGAGNKLDPTRFRVADVYKTDVCPLARVMRKELKKRGIAKLKVVYSDELPVTPIEDMAISCRAHCVCPPGTQRKCTVRRAIPGSAAFVPPVMGLILAGEVIKDLARGAGA
jgi:tRNA A37 threonylcarbamoyladenosine dehydratase